MQKFVLPGLLLLALLAAFGINTFIKSKIDPKKSAAHFVLYVIVYLLVIFGVVFGVSLLIFHYRDLWLKNN
ncbi:MAG: hypothetical protein JST02_03370 [Bacteroidetes bacterium]|nr:hypothetical protein [Bacteroidota bacterium]